MTTNDVTETVGLYVPLYGSGGHQTAMEVVLGPATLGRLRGGSFLPLLVPSGPAPTSAVSAAVSRGHLSRPSPHRCQSLGLEIAPLESSVSLSKILS